MKPTEVVQIDTARGYAAWARGYDAQDNPMIAAVERYLDRHRLPFPGARVLDVGCGTGRTMARALTEGAASVTGLDASQEMLALARERLAVPAREGRVTLLNADLARPWPKLASVPGWPVSLAVRPRRSAAWRGVRTGFCDSNAAMEPATSGALAEVPSTVTRWPSSHAVCTP